MGATCCKNGLDTSDELDDKTGMRKNVKFLTHAELIDEISKNSVRNAKGKVLVNLEMIETILLEEDEDTATDMDQDQLQRKRVKDRKGTGFVTKKQVEAAAGKVGFADVQAEDKKAVNERIKGRKGTGFVTKERLLAALDSIESDEEEEPADIAKPVIAQAPVRGKGRKGTGFVTKEKLQKLISTIGDDEEE
mmetsp:Transcript_116929/g.184937  ORF Transcript_116929/g.184937 Transcript_116929/m.184937 type:complete len:192 (-) Transcript_116929:19-594(-)|eukprot:CAMPEP_0169111960 /NCGR_PEP_ID=MMETSP1015-20121227/27368_1 /TAXON_ID=342587 /ORGANISM="Karlodinium micrum, Strain CCMP2283" /LENGTH=191 /DNA_ID=CAMNT_0009173941 /DNA_START=71 /DNA_END=646 /DNA_ORIENTATION=-